jgi:hypothetical protein
MTNPTPPGWYPDGRDIGNQRWWDGTQWTEHVQRPYQAGGMIPRAAEGTSPNTPYIWWIVAIFAAQLVAGLAYMVTIDWNGYMISVMESARSSSPDPFAMYSYIFTPGYFVLILMSILVYGGTVLLAYLDVKALRDRGIERPFPWPLAFIPSSYGTLVYVIGRSVVAKRRTGTGLAPMWVLIAVFVLAIILSTIVAFAIVATTMGSIDPYSYS